MFTGLVEQVGTIRSIQQNGNGLTLEIKADKIVKDVALGDSIAVDGVCLTVTQFTHNSFRVDAVGETVSRSTLKERSVGDAVNLERALMAGQRMGGHIVQGHVDAVAKIAKVEQRDPEVWLIVDLPDSLQQFVVEKGSVTIDGLSLTIAETHASSIAIAVIPHTAQVTTIGHKKAGDAVNIEVDVLAKYIHKMVQPYKDAGLTMDTLKKYGF